jgi:hypothetical protein
MRYLTLTLTRDGYNHKEINRRLSIGRMAMTKLEKNMKNRNVKKATKIKITEATVFPTVTYGSESWTVRKKEKNKINAFELWTWRKITSSSLDREKNKTFSFGRCETLKII